MRLVGLALRLLLACRAQARSAQESRGGASNRAAASGHRARQVWQRELAIEACNIQREAARSDRYAQPRSLCDQWRWLGCSWPIAIAVYRLPTNADNPIAGLKAHPSGPHATGNCEKNETLVSAFEAEAKLPAQDLLIGESCRAERCSCSVFDNWRGAAECASGLDRGAVGSVAFLLVGGDQLGDNEESPLSWFALEESKQIHQALSEVSDDEPWSRFGADWMEQPEINPGIWDEAEDDLKEEYAGLLPRAQASRRVSCPKRPTFVGDPWLTEVVKELASITSTAACRTDAGSRLYLTAPATIDERPFEFTSTFQTQPIKEYKSIRQRKNKAVQVGFQPRTKTAIASLARREKWIAGCRSATVGRRGGARRAADSIRRWCGSAGNLFEFRSI